MLRAVDHDAGNVQSTQIPVGTPFYYSERDGQAYQADMGQMLGAYDYSQAVGNNQQAINHIAKEIDRNSSWFGLSNKDQLAGWLSQDPTKTVGVVHAYGALKGNPLAIFKDTEGTKVADVILNALTRSNDFRSVQAVAGAILNAGEGIGTDKKTIEKLIVEPKKTMSEQDYNRYIANLTATFEQVSGGQTLTDFIRDEYSFLSGEGKLVDLINNAVINNENSGPFGGYNMFGAQGAF